MTNIPEWLAKHRAALPPEAPPGAANDNLLSPPGKSGKCLLGGSPWQVTPSTIPGKDGGPVHHPAACPT
jgi:hypothetical protein